jgi:hypothetical protein
LPGRLFPFAAPNSHSTPKIRRSLTFPPLLKNTRATLPHGRPCPGPNPEVPPSSIHRTPPPDTSLRHPASSNSFASYHIHSTPVFSCNYALFCATAIHYPSQYQQLPHSSCHHGGVPVQLQIVSVLSVPLWQIHSFHRLGASLSSLCALFRTCFLCFQSFAASFQKTPGVGVPKISSSLCSTALRRASNSIHGSAIRRDS